MATTYTLISSNTLSSSAASVTFSSIPSTYTDLALRLSVREDNTSLSSSELIMWVNGGTDSNYSSTVLQGNGSAASSYRLSGYGAFNIRYSAYNSTTANTFTSFEIYIPSYSTSSQKPMSAIAAYENNATTAYTTSNALLWSTAASINSITFLANNLYLTGSSFYLYGIKNS